jgi:hypothetical protein
MRLFNDRLPLSISIPLNLDQARRLLMSYNPKVKKTRLYSEKEKPPIICRMCADYPDEQDVIYLKRAGWTKFERTKIGNTVKRNANCPRCEEK